MTKRDDRLAGPILHYELVERVGQGGMGEVYRAVDLNLGRTVAVKILPPASAESPDRVARFEREARVASALQHPHIASIYEVGQDGDVRFIAMEFVEGVSLGKWLAQTSPPLATILGVLEQVGDALACAHRASVLHRDLKPGNVLVSRDGYAKLVDFGLAKVEVPAASDENTRDMVDTRTGVVLGTMAYMSPEQARGQAVDRRSDIFSFGILVYEATAGFHPFAAAAGLEAATAVLRDDPIPLLRQRAHVPPALVRIIQKALEKEPARRYQFMDDLVVDLREVRRAVEAGETFETDAAWGGQGWVWGAGAFLAAAALMVFVLRGPVGRRSAGGAPLHLAATGLALRPLTVDPGLDQQPSISPDGSLVAWASNRYGSFDVLMHEVATGRLERLTDEPGDELEPAFSPDGRSLAFATRRGEIKVVPAAGGPARTIVAEGADGPAWSPDGRLIAYRRDRRLFSVAAGGGAPRGLSVDGDLEVLMRAAWSPDGSGLVFPAISEGGYVLAWMPADGGRAQVIGRDAQALGSPVFSGDGRWIVGAMGPPRELAAEIWALAMSARREVGRPERLLGGVLYHTTPSLNRDGRRMAFEAVDLRTYVSRFPLGARGPLVEPTRIPSDVRIANGAVSHSGAYVAVHTDRGGRWALWRMAVDGGAVEPMREGSGHEEDPAWSPDDKQIALSHIQGPSRRVAVMPSAGGPLTYVSEPELFARDPSWSPDGRSIAFVSAGKGWSLRVGSPDGGATRELITHSQRIRRPAWSPDGRRIVTALEEPGGRWHLAVFAPDDPKPLRVVDDARSPLWLADGRIVFVRQNAHGGWDLWSVPTAAGGLPLSERQEPLTNLPPGMGVDVDLPASSDGRYLYFTVIERASDDVWLAEAP